MAEKDWDKITKNHLKKIEICTLKNEIIILHRVLLKLTLENRELKKKILVNETIESCMQKLKKGAG